MRERPGLAQAALDAQHFDLVFSLGHGSVQPVEQVLAFGNGQCEHAILLRIGLGEFLDVPQEQRIAGYPLDGLEQEAAEVEPVAFGQAGAFAQEGREGGLLQLFLQKLDRGLLSAAVEAVDGEFGNVVEEYVRNAFARVLAVFPVDQVLEEVVVGQHNFVQVGKDFGVLRLGEQGLRAQPVDFVSRH